MLLIAYRRTQHDPKVSQWLYETQLGFNDVALTRNLRPYRRRRNPQLIPFSNPSHMRKSLASSSTPPNRFGTLTLSISLLRSNLCLPDVGVAPYIHTFHNHPVIFLTRSCGGFCTASLEWNISKYLPTRSTCVLSIKNLSTYFIPHPPKVSISKMFPPTPFSTPASATSNC